MKFLLYAILLHIGSLSWCHFVQKYYERSSGGGNYKVMKEMLIPYLFLCEEQCTIMTGCISFSYDNPTEICMLLGEPEGETNYIKNNGWVEKSKSSSLKIFYMVRV